MKGGFCIRLLEALHETEIIEAQSLVDWKDGNAGDHTQQKIKTKALLDNYKKEMIGGTESMNVSDLIGKIDPSNQQNDEEYATESDEDEVHNEYLGGDALQVSYKQDDLPDADYGDWD